MAKDPTVKETLDRARKVLAHTLKIMAKEDKRELGNIIEALGQVNEVYMLELQRWQEKKRTTDEECLCKLKEQVTD